MSTKPLHSRSGIFILLLLLALIGPLTSLAAWQALQQLLQSISVGASESQALQSQINYTVYLLIAASLISILLAVVLYFLLKQKIFTPIGQAYTHFEQAASGNFSWASHSARQRATILGPFSNVIQQLGETVTRCIAGVRAGISKIDDEAQTIAQGGNRLAQRIEQQVAALSQTTSRMEVLAGTVKQNADNARQANQLAATASEVAHRGGEAVGEVVSTMHEISASSKQIADIVTVIDSIAFQTNILALNAAVEAARAGEQGKGFAVVASEVRALAQRSAHAAREINDLIDDSVKRVAEGSEQVERAGTTMEEIVRSVARVTDIIGEISAATIEQTSGIEEVKQVVTEMSASTEENIDLLQENNRSLAELQHYLKTVERTISPIRLEGQTKTHLLSPSSPSAEPATKVSKAAKKSSPTNKQKTLAQNKPARLGAGTQTQTTHASQASAAENKTATPSKKPTSRTQKQQAAEPLLRPQLSQQGVQYQSEEDEWEEF